jgi:hypothetical protein
MIPKTRWLAAAVLQTAIAWPAAHADGVPGQGTWQTVLQARDLNGDGTADAYYDSSRNITWAAEADPIGAVSFASAQSWVTSMNLYGVTGWRLPGLKSVTGGVPSCDNDYRYDGSGDCGYNVDPALSELAHVYQVVLGNLPYYDRSAQGPQPGWGLSNTGPFRHLVEGDYPSSITDAYQGTPLVWLFQTQWGYQDRGLAEEASFHAWAVHDGDIAAAVPEPRTWALLLGGAALLLARRRFT